MKQAWPEALGVVLRGVLFTEPTSKINHKVNKALSNKQSNYQRPINFLWTVGRQVL